MRRRGVRLADRAEAVQRRPPGGHGGRAPLRWLATGDERGVSLTITLRQRQDYATITTGLR